MKIALIGMSGVGKTYWSKKLEEEKGFVRFAVDDLIEVHFKEELEKLGLVGGLNDMAQMRGQPYEKRYKKNEIKHIEVEQTTMEEILDKVESMFDKNVIVETTGSLVYIDKKVLKRIKEMLNVVYIRVGKEYEDEMYKQFIKLKRALIWGESFDQCEGESGEKALERCFPKVLKWRSERYEKLADVVVDYEEVIRVGFGVDELISLR